MEIGKDFKKFVELLNDHKVEYMVVGGFSVAYHGYPRYTGDIDIWINPTESNSKKMMTVLEQFGFGSMGVSQEDFMHPDKVIQFGVEPVRIDVMTAISGIGNFNKAFSNRDKAINESLKINFIGFDDLIINKKSTDRLKDQLDVQELLKVKKSKI